MSSDHEGLVARALDLDKFAVSKLISLFEDRRPEAAAQRAAVLDLLDSTSGTVLGITGTPGSGKSTLLSRLTVDLLQRDPELSLAVVAVDPSSHVSGGALLGDRTRMRFTPDERRLFFRSQASATDLGGLGPSSFQVCRLLTRLFDCVLIETVGIGQSEADIRHLADRVYLVLQPLGGDEVQFLKAGIVEVPHVFILNKSDEPSSDLSYHQLNASMWLARPFDEIEPPIFRTSAISGEGLEPLEADMLAAIRTPGPLSLRDREPYFFERWVDDEWGRVGSEYLLGPLGGATSFLGDSGGYDRAQGRFGAEFIASLGTGKP
ncbi:MAG: methylmalonyl Co-A mutase-associated GTPase MeaB [Microthrixaceae bacterium]